MTGIYGDSRYYIPVLDIKLDSPVLEIEGDEANSLVSSTDILELSFKLDIHHVGDNDAHESRLASIHPIPYPLVNQTTKILLEQSLAHGTFALGYSSFQFVPAKIYLNGKIYNYDLFHILKEISCLDLINTEAETFDDGQIFAIDKLVLDYEKLDKYVPEDRKIFRLGELPYLCLFEKSIVELLVNSGMYNVVFVAAENWNSDIEFQI